MTLNTLKISVQQFGFFILERTTNGLFHKVTHWIGVPRETLQSGTSGRGYKRAKRCHGINSFLHSMVLCLDEDATQHQQQHQQQEPRQQSDSVIKFESRFNAFYYSLSSQKFGMRQI